MVKINILTDMYHLPPGEVARRVASDLSSGHIHACSIGTAVITDADDCMDVTTLVMMYNADVQYLTDFDKEMFNGLFI